ncbi:MAG: hypothetical protein HC779_06035 [Phyllobacteriaceae bacterium]|nr:hypothetical protein [Phyllobacteriaceae bacterium]
MIGFSKAQHVFSRPSRRFYGALALAGLAIIKAPHGGVKAAAAQTFAAEYSISFAGIPVARSTFSTIVNGDTLSLKGKLSSAGLGSVFSSTNATSSITGR